MVARLQTADKERIVQELECEYWVQGVLTELAIQALPKQRTVNIPNVYQPFASVFSEEESQRFPPSCPWDHAIKLKPEAPDHLCCKVYPMTREEDQALNNFINKQLLKGYISPSKSPYVLSFFFIKKKDGKL